MAITFVDVDFNTINKAKGLIFEDNHTLAAAIDAENFRDVEALVPRAEWKAVAKKEGPKLRKICNFTPIKNQKSEGSCVANAETKGFEFRQAYQHGDKTELSAMSLYKRIGRSASSGANISEGMKEMQLAGALPLDTAANKAIYTHTFPATGFSTRYPNGYQETAVKFEVESYLRINNTDEWFSALVKGFPVVYGRNGHCILSVYPEYDSKGNLYFVYANSWGNWGDAGYGADSERTIDRCIGYAIQDITFREELS